MKLKEKIDNKSAKIGVIGLGYVGLPLAVEFANSGYDTIGIDIDDSKIKSINNNNNYIDDINDNLFKKLINNNKLTATNDFKSIKKLDCISICVPTPLNKEKEPDMSFIISAMEKIEKYIHPNLLIILESTTYPGSTRELILPLLEKKELVIGENIFLCFSPERIDPGNKTYNTKNTPKIMGGITENCTILGTKLYEKIVNKVVKVTSTETAEMVKLLENTFRAINIGLANEVAIMCEKLGVNAWEVIDAAATKPFGFMKFTPGPGLGGHCIPIDPYYLSWKLKILDYDARFIKLAGEINTQMPRHVLNLTYISLNKVQKSLNGSKILILGVAYKKDINDIRESPALDIIQLFYDSGAKINYFDEYVPEINMNNISLNSLKSLEKKEISDFDVCVVITDHSNVQYDLIYDHCKLIIDTRNVFKNAKGDHIIRLGQG